MPVGGWGAVPLRVEEMNNIGEGTGLEGVFHVPGAGGFFDYGVVRVVGTEGAEEILRAEELKVVCHWKDLGLTVKV